MYSLYDKKMNIFRLYFLFLEIDKVNKRDNFIFRCLEGVILNKNF